MTLRLLLLALLLSSCSSYQVVPSSDGAWLIRTTTAFWLPFGEAVYWCPNDPRASRDHWHRYCSEANFHRTHEGIGFSSKGELK